MRVDLLTFAGFRGGGDLLERRDQLLGHLRLRIASQPGHAYGHAPLDLGQSKIGYRGGV